LKVFKFFPVVFPSSPAYVFHSIPVIALVLLFIPYTTIMSSVPSVPDESGSRKRSRATTMTRSNITACMRCRQKKKRCDQNVPVSTFMSCSFQNYASDTIFLQRCGLCETAGAECVGYDAVAKRHVPRRSICRCSLSY
jgi:hypothetical protein